MEWFIRTELRYFRMKDIGKYISNQMDLLISWQVNYENKNKNTTDFFMLLHIVNW